MISTSHQTRPRFCSSLEVTFLNVYLDKMPGRNDWSNGFTKSANKTKFVRKRDIKMKDSEVRKEAHITRAMCEGICKRCIEKAEWRFKYDKYKPLKNVGNCQQCKQKCITKAYRTLCDKCALARKVCPSCVVDMEESNKLYEITSLKNHTTAKEKRDKKAADGEEGEGEEEGDEESVEMGDDVDGEEEQPDEEAEDMEEED